MRTTLPVTSLDRLEAPPAPTIDERASVLDAITRIRESERGVVLIVDDDGRLTGILTERDLVRAAANSRGEDWRAAPVTRWMRADPARLRASDSIARVIHRMNADRFTRLPVVDAEDRPVGLVTIRDVLTYIVESFPAEFANLPPDPQREASRRWGG